MSILHDTARAGRMATLWFLLSVTAAAFAASPAPPTDAKAATAETADKTATTVRPAELVVFNRPIVMFRALFVGNPPADRALSARTRIDRLLERGNAGAVSQETAPAGVVVKIDGVYVFIVTPGDVEVLTGETLESIAAKAVQALEQAIAETHESRNLRTLGHALLASAVATALFLALLWGLWWARRAAATLAQKLAQKHVQRLRVGGTALVQMEQLYHIAQRVTNALLTVVALLLAYAWLDFVLQRFPYTRRWGEQLHAFLLDTAALLIDGMLDALPNLLIAVLIFLIARFFAKMLKGFFRRVESGRLEVGWLDADTAGPTARIFSLLIWAFALVMAYPYLPGANTDAFKGISVLLGLMVSLGASSTIGQAASGLILMYTRTIRVGEYVRIADHEGTITELGMFNTRIRTGMGEELTLPNSMVVGTVTKNYSRVSNGRGYVIDTTVTIGYDAPWRQIHALLLEAARRTDGIVEDPPPRVFQTALSDFYVEYRLAGLAIPSDPRPRAQVLNMLHQNIQDVFNEHGVQIMSPHYLGDPPQAKLVPKDQWYAAPAQPPYDASAR